MGHPITALPANVMKSLRRINSPGSERMVGQA
jgi:hypothetical protein